MSATVLFLPKEDAGRLAPMRETSRIAGVFIVYSLVRATTARPLDSLHREKWIPLDLTPQDQVGLTVRCI